ncbi:MAG: FliH/SctL family protein [Kiritimatiellae bacterium]|nr:FliH/SctL family protein [Kiritimatiellia bacterium]
MTTSSTLVLSPGVQGFTVSTSRRITPTIIQTAKAPPPAGPVVPKKAPPPPDPDTLRKKILAEVEPRIREETEKRVRAEEAARYKKQLETDVTALKEAHERSMQEEMKQRDALLQKIQQRMEKFILDMKAEIADQVVCRSVQIAEMMLRHALPDREMLLRLLQETLGTVSDLQGAKIRIHPDDLVVLNARETPGIPFAGQFEWCSDTSIQPGDLVIESRNGIFDASLKQRLALLEEQLRRRVGKIHGIDSTT